MIVADTGAILALLDAGERHHEVLLAHYRLQPQSWHLPWAILPEVDYLIATRLGAALQRSFLADLADGSWAVDWGDPADLIRAAEIGKRHQALQLGLVDCVVMAVAERLEADAIATLDIKHFSAVRIRGNPQLLPRDLGQ